MSDFLTTVLADKELTASLIEAGGTVVGAIIGGMVTGLFGLIVGWRVWDNKRLKRKLVSAIDEIEALLAVEDYYVKESTKLTKKNHRNLIRMLVRKDTKLCVTGKFSPSDIIRLKRELDMDD